MHTTSFQTWPLILHLVVLCRGGMLNRMSNLVTDVSGAQSGASKAERMIREAIEVQ